MLIAYDQGDRWFETHHQELRRLCLLQFQEAARGAAVPDDAVQIRCVDNPSGSNPVFAWNVLFQIAHQQGLDYCLQLGDDVTCLTRDWDVRLLQALRRSDNWGVAGGWNGNDDIITQAFVHTASHTQLFGALYPSSLRNWGSDTWIDHAYRSVPGLRDWLRDEVKMRNGIWADTGSADCNRYQIAPDWEAVLAVVLKDGRDRIAEHFESTLATPVMAVCTTASRSDVHSLELFARSLRLFEPAVALLVGTRVADQDFLHSWCESRRELGIQVLPAHAAMFASARPAAQPLLAGYG